MRILILCNKLPYPSNDGSSIAIASMISGYLETGVDLTVLSLNTKKHYKDPAAIPPNIKAAVRFEIIDVDTNPTFGNAFANLFQRLPFHVSRFVQKPVLQRLNSLLTENIFDIVQCEGIFMMPYKLLIWKLSDAKIVLRAHNVEHRIWERTTKEEPKPILKAFLKTQSAKLKRYEIHCAKKADAILPITPIDAAFFSEYNDTIHPVPCGIQSAKANEKLNCQQFFHLGAMDWLPNQKGIDWLLTEVWPEVMKKNNKLSLHLAGRAMSKELKNIKQEGVHIHGEVVDAKAFRQQHGVMLVPLHSGSGMRIKIIEGLAEGIPIISTSVGAEGIEAEDGKNIRLADDKDAFVDAILKMAEDDHACQSIGKNAATLAAEKYLNKALIADLVGYYTDKWQIS